MNQEEITWTQQEDEIILKLIEHEKITNWTQILYQFNNTFINTNKKQQHIKQRYQNHLCSSVLRVQWTHQQQKLFIQLHNKIGNKWATIAQSLTGKTDNCVKNHFYSKLRKLLRKINKIIQFFLKKQFRQIDISILYKIVEAVQQRFKEKPNCDLNISTNCMAVENKMLQFAMFSESMDQAQDVKLSSQNIQQYKQLISQIYRVSKLYKRKSKKIRNSLIQAPINHSKRKQKKVIVKVEQQIHDKQITIEKQIINQQQKIILPKQKTITKINRPPPSVVIEPKKIIENKDSKRQKQKRSIFLDPDFEMKKQKKKKPTNAKAKIQIQQGDGIHQLLRNDGMLFEPIQNEFPSRKTRRQYPTNFSSNLNNPVSPSSNSVQNHINFYTEFSPMNSFMPQNMQNFLGFPMLNIQGPKIFKNFALSQKSSFKSYSQVDASQIQNSFFDYESANGNVNGNYIFHNSNIPISAYPNVYTYASGSSLSYPLIFYGNQLGQKFQQTQKSHPNQQHNDNN